MAVSQSIAVHPVDDVINTSIVPSVFKESNGTGSIQSVWWTIAPRGARHSRGQSSLTLRWRGRNLMWCTGRAKAPASFEWLVRGCSNIGLAGIRRYYKSCDNSHGHGERELLHLPQWCDSFVSGAVGMPDEK